MELEVIFSNGTCINLNNAMVEEFSDGVMITAENFNRVVRNEEISSKIENDSITKYMLVSGEIIEIHYGN